MKTDSGGKTEPTPLAIERREVLTAEGSGRKAGTAPTPTRPNRIAIVEQLRGLAAFAVVWFHFTNGNARFLQSGALKTSGAFGWVGVEVFFVVSAFIIPFTMNQHRYVTSKHFLRFLFKRLLRLEPPYLACVVLTMFVGYVSAIVPGFRGSPPEYSGSQVLLHIGYLVGFSEYSWVNPVFWSLAIEFQFYLLIGLIFPLITHPRLRIRILALGMFGALALLPVSDALLFPYLLIFLLGILTFHLRVGLLATLPYLVASVLVAAIIAYTRSPLVGSVSLTAAFAIAFVRGEGPRPLIWLGTISYSLYLIHVPIGGRIINLGERLDIDFLKMYFLFAAVAVSIGAATLWFLWLESPAKRWSATIGYAGLRDFSQETKTVPPTETMVEVPAFGTHNRR